MNSDQIVEQILRHHNKLLELQHSLIDSVKFEWGLYLGSEHSFEEYDDEWENKLAGHDQVKDVHIFDEVSAQEIVRKDWLMMLTTETGIFLTSIPHDLEEIDVDEENIHYVD